MVMERRTAEREFYKASIVENSDERQDLFKQIERTNYKKN
jgi:hypothetical protein